MLVQYSDSDSGDDNEHTSVGPAEPQAVKRKRDRVQSLAADLPPLPAAFHDLYSTNARVSQRDDPSLHQGRKRAVPHVEGNWPSHVYLEWIPSHAESRQLENLIETAQAALADAHKRLPRPTAPPDVTPLLRSPLGVPLPLHISLSRTLQIRTEHRDDFLDTLKDQLRKATVSPFHIRFTTLNWVSNYERNRWFLVVGIEKPPRDELNKLLQACNDAAEKRGHPALYVGGKGDGPMEGNTSGNSAKKRKSARADQANQDAYLSQSVDRSDAFHISIAWSLVDPTQEGTNKLDAVDVQKAIQSPQAQFDVVKAKIGNVVHSIELGNKVGQAQGGGILGLG